MKLKLAGTVAVTVLLAACQSNKDKNLAEGETIPGSYADFQRNVNNHAYFTLNSSTLDQQAKSNLDQVANWSRQYPQTAMVVEGHCDPRGTREYNLALGERRAVAAKRYLEDRGATRHIQTVSYGKDRLPAGAATDEATYARNRVAIVEPSA